MQPRPEQRAAAQDAAVGELEHRGPRGTLPARHREWRGTQEGSRQSPEQR